MNNDSQKEKVTLSGAYTREVYAVCSMYELSLLVKPDADLDSEFVAWDLDEQEFINVNGWLFTIEDAEDF